MDEPDITSKHDPWMLSEGDYIVAIGIFQKGKDGPESVKRTESYTQVRSKQDARYLFNQYIDLARRVRKLERAAGRLI